MDKERRSPVLKILVVDDIASSREDLSRRIRELGHTVIEVASGIEALLAVASQKPDLAFLDLLMPGFDGFEVCREIRAMSEGKWLPVLVTSSLEGSEPFVRALSQGADDYLTRPVEAALLEAKLRHYQRVLAMQDQVMEYAARQSAILANVLDAVITMDESGVVEDANTTASRLLLGDPKLSLKGMQIEPLTGLSSQVLLQGGELRFTKMQGDTLHADVRASLWQVEGRGLCTLLIHDLTERLRIDRMKDEFLATVSHELRTPLTSIQGALGLISSGQVGDLSDDIKELAEMASRNGVRLSQLIDDILDLTKLEGDRLVFHESDVDLRDLLREAIANNQGYAARSNVTFALSLPEQALPVRVDPHRFQQVLANLLSNAVKHSPMGDVVQIHAFERQGEAWVEVKDHGKGVDPVLLPNLFEKFSQADGSDTRSKGGAGLGLYVSRMLMERMRGRMGVTSSLGHGACFHVALPTSHLLNQRDQLPWMLHIDADVSYHARANRILGDIVQVENITSLSQRDAIKSMGLPLLIMADPANQKNADDFCEALHHVAPGVPVILHSDSVNAEFARRHGALWLVKTRLSDKDWRKVVLNHVAQHKKGNS